jgi:hypothetical protein
MYTKDLTEDLRLRLSTTDMDFLRDLSKQRGVSISECIRSIIGEYRRSLETLNILSDAISLAKKGGQLSNGDTETDIND